MSVNAKEWLIQRSHIAQFHTQKNSHASKFSLLPFLQRNRHFKPSGIDSCFVGGQVLFFVSFIAVLVIYDFKCLCVFGFFLEFRHVGFSFQSKSNSQCEFLFNFVLVSITGHVSNCFFLSNVCLHWCLIGGSSRFLVIRCLSEQFSDHSDQIPAQNFVVEHNKVKTYYYYYYYFCEQMLV